jgi:mRNA interferase RelE/StbE
LSRTYRIELAARAERDLRRLDRRAQTRVVVAVRGLAVDPRGHPKVKRLVDRDGYRLRVGDRRVLFQIEDDRLIVLVLQIGHRREVHR